MVYLIAQLAAWLLLTAAFAALAGWSFAAWRSADSDAKARRERGALVRGLGALVGDGGAADDTQDLEREREAARRMADVRDGRITELERALEAARGTADEAQARAAELQRHLTAMEADREQAALAAMEVEHATVDTPAPAPIAAPVAPEDDPSLLTWRLRYLEQRVRYLEAGGSDAPAEAEPTLPITTAQPLDAWRARVAEARAEHAENEVRALMTPPPEEGAAEYASPFAANANVDVLLRWRMLYLERRVAYMQARAAEAPAQEAAPSPVAELAPAEAGPDPDIWKWRARYLESRARHFEQRTADAEARPPTIVHLAAPEPVVHAVATPEVDELPPEAPTPAARRAKPPVLQAPRHGAPDDFTLIEGVSLLQQTTLYSLGVFHYDQVAAWSDEHVAWIDNYLRLRGRIDDQEWREQAAALSREGPVAARRLVVEDA